jgi:uncharacterized protein YcbX
MAHLSRLFVYPVKSCAGIELQHTGLDDFGVEHDRRFLVVDEDDVFMTQREHPNMSLIRISIAPPSLVFAAPDRSTCSVPLRPAGGQRTRVRIWDDDVEAIRVPAAAEWLSRAIGVRCSLVYMPDDSVRPVSPEYSVREDRIGFADAFPLLILSQASIDALNWRLHDPVDVRRFRPNFLIDGVAPHAEDSWSRVRVGSLELHVVKPCARCAITTVDPDTGVRGKEPLRTLAEYRTRDGKVYFAQNAIHARPGEVSAGDALEVLELRADQSSSTVGPGLKS